MADLDDPRTVHVPTDIVVHLYQADEDRVALDGWATVALLRQSYAGLTRALGDLGEQLRAVTADRDLAAEQARGWMDEATRQAAYRDALFSLAVLYVPLDMRRGTALDPTWTPDAPAAPLSPPVPAQSESRIANPGQVIR